MVVHWNSRTFIGRDYGNLLLVIIGFTITKRSIRELGKGISMNPNAGKGRTTIPPLRLLMRSLLGAALAVTLFSSTATADINFKRGDSNVDDAVDITDAIFSLSYLFIGNAEITCFDAADANDDGQVDISDPLTALGYLFTGGVIIPAPGVSECGPDETDDPLDCVSYEHCPQEPPEPTDLTKIGHLLNRIAYGPTLSAVDYVTEIGIDAYIEEQLNPETIDESENTDLLTRLADLHNERQPSIDRTILPPSSIWRFHRGTTPPPSNWDEPEFDDSAWEMGATSIGYGDGDDITVLEDMEDTYTSVYIRKEFQIADINTIDRLILSIDYDDSFVAYLNGTEITRSNNISGTPPAYNATSGGNHEAGEAEDFDVTNRKNLLVNGANVLALQGHNTSLGSSDFTINPSLISREILPGEPIIEYEDLDAIKAMVHVRGIYSDRQLQVVLADFWENHFTTDGEKVMEYLDELQNSDANDAMGSDQAEREAANMEAREYEFFLDNALGNFGDLLRFSAESPTMLIYLDNVLNFKGNANENYAREILELHSFGVDRGYIQDDIEEAAEVFTGWNVCKVLPEDQGDPHASCGVQYSDTTILDLGAGWKYFKGTEEPTPDNSGEEPVPTTQWADPDFDDSTWLDGSTGIGYGDGDDATVLSDMRNNYYTVYLRREIEIPDPFAFKNLLLEMQYDDGFVAYINGVEVARSETMEDEGEPPAFDTDADDNHEVDEGIEYFNLNRYLGIMQPGTNVLAIQVHNGSLGSSDLSCLPRLIDREILEGSVENGDPNGQWSIHFFPDLHDYGSKRLFDGRPYQLNIPTKPEGNPQMGYASATDLIDILVDSPPTAEFICGKLIQKFVNDEIPPSLLAECIATWNSSTPKGNIKEVMRTILTSEEFWAEENYRAKVKDPLEFINSTVRALEGDTDGRDLPDYMEDMGMHIFTRDEPDGWPETGVDWISTGGILNRIKFVQDFTANTEDFSWETQLFLSDNEIETSEEIVNFLDASLYQSTLRTDEIDILNEFLTTDNNYNNRALSPAQGDYIPRVQTGVSLMLSLPQWNFQ